MNRNRRLVGHLLAVAAVTALLFAGCSSMLSVNALGRQSQGQSIAVVSLGINDFGGALQGWNSVRTSDLMTSRAWQMVQLAEGHLSRRWQVTPAPSFVASPGYQQVAATPYDVAVPAFQGGFMGVFAPSRGQLVRAQLRPADAQALAAAAGTDYVAVIYTEWGVATGRFVPTSKALAKTVMSIYSAAGLQVASPRADARGERTLGALGHVVVDENSIGEWVGAFDAGIAQMVGE